MSVTGRKRKVDECPNRLFLSYLEGWRDDAKKKESKSFHTFNKAHKSLGKYPLPLQSGGEAIILQHFGEKICSMLDSKLAQESKERGVSAVEYLEESRDVSKSWWRSLEKKNEAKKPKIVKKKAPSRQRAYVPAKNSGAYAILLALYKNQARPGGCGFMKKAELQREAQEFCAKSMTTPDPGSQYTVWSSMATLLGKDLVWKSGNPPKFEITEAGTELAAMLEAASGEENIPPPGDIRGMLKSTASKPRKKVFELSDSDSEPTTCRSKVPESIDLTLTSSDEEPSTETRPTMKPNDVVEDVRCEFRLRPGNFEVVLCVDSREVSGDHRKKELRRELTNQNVTSVERVLQIGDFVWVAREKGVDRGLPRELVLDYVVERKCMSDLAQSIRDGRFHEQKIRLKQCGVKHVVYLVEDLNQIQHQSLPEKTLRQALLSTQITDGIFVKYSRNMATTAAYLAMMTEKLKQMYAHKTLQACDMRLVLAADKTSLVSCQLLTFQDFNDESMKCRGLTVNAMFVRMLMQLHGMSCDKAQAITSKYATPFQLRQAYQSCPGTKDKEGLLSKIKFGLLQRNIGINMSRCVYHLFTD